MEEFGVGEVFEVTESDEAAAVDGDFEGVARVHGGSCSTIGETRMVGESVVGV
jgi:hypothetical protein